MDTEARPAEPPDDVYAEACGLIAAASGAGLRLRLLGGVAIYHHCPSIRRADVRRAYKDIDLVGLGAQRADIQRLLPSLGYAPDREFNLLHGASRLLFRDQAGRQIDIFLDQFIMCHSFDLRERLAEHALTLPPADLLLTKLQVVEATENDLRDLFALLADLPLGPGPAAIDTAYIARLASRDWGLFHTLGLSLDRLEAWAADRGRVGLAAPVASLRAALDAAPKTIGWKVRAALGERVRWYELPEEVA
jgi:hypothetical protein